VKEKQGKYEEETFQPQDKTNPEHPSKQNTSKGVINSVKSFMTSIAVDENSRKVRFNSILFRL